MKPEVIAAIAYGTEARVIAMIAERQELGIASQTVAGITPRSFDPKTSREIVGDYRSRQIEEKARSDADTGTFDPPISPGGGSYWSQVQSSFDLAVYRQQYQRRTERNARKSGKADGGK